MRFNPTVKRTMTEIADVAAIAPAENELSEFFEMCMISGRANELALSCKIPGRRD